MQIIKEFEQGSPEWHAWRLGKITGTRLGSIWSSRAYNKEDIEQLLLKRGFDLAELQATMNAERKAVGQRAKAYTKADLEALLTDDDKDELSMGGDKKIEFYQILADNIAVAPADEEIDGEYGKYRNAMDRGSGEELKAIAMFEEYTGKKVLHAGGFASSVDPRVVMSPDGYVDPVEVSDGVSIITEAVEVKHLSSAKHLQAFFERKIPEDYWTQKVQYFTVNENLKTLYWVFRDPRIPMLPMFILVVHREDLGHWPDTMLKYQLRTLREIDRLTERLFEESNNILLPARPDKEQENEL